MDEGKPISRFAQRFVARKLQEFEKQATKGCGFHYELFSQNFTDRVDWLAGMAKRPDLREHIRAEAVKTGNYMGEEARKGRWDYDVEAGDVVWRENVAKPVSPATKYGYQDTQSSEVKPLTRSR